MNQGITHLDSNVCYQALLSMDARFDGCFFVAVRTTGIYCRPICTARKARRANVTFFPSAAAAENAGFRPCRRCHPEAAPGSPVWNGPSALISRAIALIENGAFDREGAHGIARALGVSERHLTRLFSEHYGTSPGAIAQTRRVHFAKRLIDQTALPMSKIAFCSGFSSIRRFNAQIRETFGQSPTGLRSRPTTKRNAVDNESITLRLPYRPPLAWPQLLDFFGARTIPGVEWVSDGKYQRTVSLEGQVGSIEVGQAECAHCLMVRFNIPPEHIRPDVVNRIRNIFDLGANPMAIAQHLGKDRMLAPSLRRLPGLRVPGGWDGFELAVRGILGQQVSVQAATTLSGRIVKAFGTPIPHPRHERLTHIFPGPEILKDVDIASIGLPKARAQTIRDLANAVVSRKVKLDGSQSVNDCLQLLQTIRGIGPWTANYVAMRVLRDPDAFLAGDLGILRKLGGKGKPSPLTAQKRAEAWRPWRAYAAMYLWNG